MRENNPYRLNNRQIAEMAGISDNLVAAVLQGRPNTSIENYVAVAKTLGCLAEVEAVVRGQIPSA